MVGLSLLLVGVALSAGVTVFPSTARGCLRSTYFYSTYFYVQDNVTPHSTVGRNTVWYLVCRTVVGALHTLVLWTPPGSTIEQNLVCVCVCACVVALNRSFYSDIATQYCIVHANYVH